MARLGPVVAVAAGDDRSQARNRAAAVERLRNRLARALATEPDRTPTRPTRASQRRRLDTKRRRGLRKRERRFKGTTDDD
jgi:ribosome-associated protein